jgi:hypothetical protein
MFHNSHCINATGPAQHQPTSFSQIAFSFEHNAEYTTAAMV